MKVFVQTEVFQCLLFKRVDTNTLYDIFFVDSFLIVFVWYFFVYFWYEDFEDMFISLTYVFYFDLDRNFYISDYLD